MNFAEVAIECIKTTELVKEFNRLSKCNLGVDKRTPIEKMIDEATGSQDGIDRQDMRKFVVFVYKFIWSPLIEGVKGERYYL